MATEPRVIKAVSEIARYPGGGVRAQLHVFVGGHSTKSARERIDATLLKIGLFANEEFCAKDLDLGARIVSDEFKLYVVVSEDGAQEAANILRQAATRAGVVLV